MSRIAALKRQLILAKTPLERARIRRELDMLLRAARETVTRPDGERA